MDDEGRLLPGHGRALLAHGGGARHVFYARDAQRAGTGLLAADLLLELELRGSLPESYAILEVSG